MSDTPDNTEDVTDADGGDAQSEIEAEATTLDIENASEAELRARADELREQIDALRAEDLTIERAEQITALKAERNSVVGAVNTLVAAMASEEPDAEMADAIEVTDTAETAEVEAETAEEAPVSEDITPEPVEQPAEAAAESTPEVNSIADSPELVEAAEAVMADAVVAGAGERPVNPGGPAYTRPRAAYVAGAGQTAFAQGQELDDAGMANAWESMRTQLRPGANGTTARAVVASIRPFESEQEMPVAMLGKSNPIEVNDRLIGESVEAWRAKRRGEVPPAHTAAICDPLDIIREIPYGGETDTPFSDMFPQRPISRLGFQFTRASSITEAASGVAVWTEANQNSVDIADPSTWKPTVQIECATPDEIKAEELTTSATVDTSTEMSSPERIGEFMHKLAVARARRREQYILGLFDETASPYTLTGTFGAMATFTQAIHTVLPQLFYGERLDEGDYDIVLDPGYLNKLVIDECVKCETMAEDVLKKIRKEVGLNVVVLRDFVGASPFQAPVTPGGSADALSALPSTNRVRIVPAGAYIYGATGEQATGWQTDPQLARQNRMQAFSQEWTLLAKHGEHPAAFIDITSNANGARGGCVTPS